MADPAVYNAILAANKTLQLDIQSSVGYSSLRSLQECPWDTTLWTQFPLITNPVGCLCVYDNSSTELRCGANCTWTVPSGVTTAQFQLWGAGGGSGSGCCCGGAPFGATGAFGTVIIPVTPGDSYTLCAGCAYCCYVCHGTHNLPGCPSYVTGPGLCNFCAMGGYAGAWRSMLVYGFQECRYRNPDCTSSGACICNTGTDYCFSNSCATCGCICFRADDNQTWHGCAPGYTVIGMPSILGSGCFDTDNYGYHEHPPLIGPCHTVQTNSCCCHCFTSQTCGGCCCKASTGVLCYPGAGGFASHIMGQCNTRSGDAGKGGMVRVTWC